MLFKKKDTNESSKAKTELQASRAKRDEAREKANETREEKNVAGSVKSESARTFAAGRAAGRVSPSILRRPRITEKATLASSFNVYTFDVLPSANKKMIMGAIKDIYNVTPVQVRVVTIPAKRLVSRRGVRGSTSKGKKAYVYLKKGDTIEIV